MTPKPFLFLTLMMGAAAPALAEESAVAVFNWADYIGPSTVADFQTETGLTVHYDTFDSNEFLETKLMAGQSGYDVVVPASNFLARQVTAGAFLPLDRALLPNYGNLDPVLLEKFAESDPGNLYAVPYTWGTVGLAYNAKAVGERLGGTVPRSFDLLLDPATAAKLADCGIAVTDSPAEVVAATLSWLGRDPNSEVIEDLEAATAALTAIRPHIRHFHTAQIIADLANGDICLALTYNGDASIAAARIAEAGLDTELGFLVPAEGAQVFFDALAIPADAPNPAGAHAFIDYLLRGEVAAAMTNAVYFANANAAAAAHVDPAILSDPTIYPPEEVRARLFTLKPHDPKFDRKLTRAWTLFRAGQ